MNDRKRDKQLQFVPALERATHAVSVYLQKGPDLGCTQAEANVLAFLYGRGDVSLSDVHASFGHRRSTLTSVIDRLEDRDLVVRKRDPKDGRALILGLTPAGNRVARAVTTHLHQLEFEAASSLSDTDIRRFIKVANAIVESAQKE